MSEGRVNRYDPPAFGGETFDEDLDLARITHLLHRVKYLMLDGQWRTFAEIKKAVGGSESSISARLRDLRKSRYGGWTVNRRRRGDEKRGLYEYQVAVREPRS